MRDCSCFYIFSDYYFVKKLDGIEIGIAES